MKIIRTNYSGKENDKDTERNHQEDEVALKIISKGRDNLEDLS
jgi:hypothetical protein